MMEHVNLSGHPRDVTVQTVTKETDVINALTVTMVEIVASF